MNYIFEESPHPLLTMLGFNGYDDGSVSVSRVHPNTQVGDIYRNGMGDSYVWGDVPVPSWVSERTVPLISEKREIYEFLMNHIENVKSYMVKMGSLNNLDNFTKANLSSSLWSELIGGIYVGEDGQRGFDTIHPKWGKLSDKGQQKMFQKTTGKTEQITVQKTRSENQTQNIDYNVMFLYQTKTPLSVGFVLEQDAREYYSTEIYGTLLQVPFEKITFIIPPSDNLMLENYAIDGLPKLGNFTYADLRKSVVRKL